MKKQQWWSRRRPRGESERTAREVTDEEILRLVRESLKSEAGKKSQTHEQNLLRQVKESVTIQAYLSGEASLDKVRPYLRCEQCVRLLESARKQFQMFGQPGAGAGSGSDSGSHGPPQASNPPIVSNRQRLWFLVQSNWRPVMIGAVATSLVVSFLLIALPALFPRVAAVLRYNTQPRPILRESGHLADKVTGLLVQSEKALYVAPTPDELRAMQSAAELVALSLKIKNDILLAEASKAADLAGYALVEYEDESRFKAIVLQEKAGQSRGRGTYFFRRDNYDGGLIVVAPHALRDDDTGRFAFECFTRIPGADAFFLSGAQTSYIDEAHTENTIFNAIFRATIQPQSVCLSLHGFDETKSGRADYPRVVISSGSVTEPIVQRIHTVLQNEMSSYVPVGIYDGKRFADVAGTLDQQGIIASSVNSLVAHLELSRAVRFNPLMRDQVMAALAGVLGNVESEVVSKYAEPAGRNLVGFTKVVGVPRDLLVKYGNNAVFIHSSQMKRLRLRSGDLALVSQGDKQAVVRVFSYPASDDEIHLTAAMRRRLGVREGNFRVQISRLPE